MDWPGCVPDPSWGREGAPPGEVLSLVSKGGRMIQAGPNLAMKVLPGPLSVLCPYPSFSQALLSACCMRPSLFPRA